MAVCKKCNAELTRNAKFCQKCGAPVRTPQQTNRDRDKNSHTILTKKCPACETEISADALDCPVCGRIFHMKKEATLQSRYCENCGQQLVDGAKFCFSCGAAIARASAHAEKTQSQRKQVFEGEIRKCPNCGKPLASFELVCLACGYEIRNAKASKIVQEFSRQLDSIGRDEYMDFGKRRKSKNELRAYEQKRNDRKIELIRSFPIPNTKEDLFEFIILAASNMESVSNPTLSEAWASKFEQAYQKAKFSFKNDSDFKKIYTFYKEKKELYEENKPQPKDEGSTLIIIVIVICIFGLAALLGIFGR